MEKKYKVVVNGTVLEGFDRGKAVSNIAAVFKLDPSVAERMLDGTPRTIKKDLVHSTAEKYEKIILKAGVACSIVRQKNETVTEPVKSGSDELKDVSRNETPAGTNQVGTAGHECPRCGYEPNSPNDTIFTRGDCPKCGFIVNKKLFDDFHAADDEKDQEDNYDHDFFQDWIPASKERKLLASLYTFTLFLWIYLALLAFCIFAFVPVVHIPAHLFKKFYQTALIFFPEFLTGIAIVMISLIMPAYYEGRTWGQKKAGIEILFVPEAQSRGFYLSLILRTLTVLALTYLPGYAVIKLVNWIKPFENQSMSLLITASSAGIAWLLSRLAPAFRNDEKSLIDLAAGTVQTEVGLVSIDAVRQATIKLSQPIGLIILFTLVIPGILRLFRI